MYGEYVSNEALFVTRPVSTRAPGLVFLVTHQHGGDIQVQGKNYGSLPH